MKNKGLWTAIGIISGLCLVVFALRLAVFIPSFGMWFYSWQYDVNDTYAVVDMKPEHLMEVTRHMVDYMRGNQDDLQILTIVGGQPRYFFSDIEIRHMIDVRDLFAAANLIVLIAGLCFAATCLAAAFTGRYRRKLRLLIRCWRGVAAGVFAGLALLAAVIGINWHQAFIIFHEIFFNNDYWILDARIDLLVNIVPYNFFITLSVVIAAFFTLGLGIIFAASTILLKKTGPRRARFVVAAAAPVAALFGLGVLGVVAFVTFCIILGLIALILLVLYIALFCKTRYVIDIKKSSKDADLEYRAKIIAPLGLYRKTFTHLDEKTKNKKVETKDKSEDAELEVQNMSLASRFSRLRSNFPLIRPTLQLAKKLFRVCRPKKIVIKGRYGASEPHTTGLTLAAIAAVAVMFDIDAQIEGDFEEEVLEFDAHLSGYLRLWAVLVPLARYIFNPEIKPLILSRFGRKSKNNKPKERENGK